MCALGVVLGVVAHGVKVARIVGDGVAVGVCALQHHSHILPVAVRTDGVDVFVCQVDAARKGRVPVYDQDLAVVTVIIVLLKVPWPKPVGQTML